MLLVNLIAHITKVNSNMPHPIVKNWIFTKICNTYIITIDFRRLVNWDTKLRLEILGLSCFKKSTSNYLKLNFNKGEEAIVVWFLDNKLMGVSPKKMR